jgi:phosphoribosylformylglycinamidine cyclo-ligase
MSGPMTYAGTGVNYDAMDPFKRLCQVAARETAANLERFGYKEFEPSRGESCYLMEGPDDFVGHVEEGLGTKNLVADAMALATGGWSYYDRVAQDTVAMIVNDMITVGCRPRLIAMHLAVGDSDWFKDEARSEALVRGWKKACNLARCTWSGGETPTLKDVVRQYGAVLAGSAEGVVKPKSQLMIGSKIRPGDAIVFLGSSGIHANGLTLARKIAMREGVASLPKGYLTEVAGRTYGETLLDPTHIYVEFIEDCLDAGVDLHYGVNVTGHGLRKLMRAEQNFAYIVERLPAVPPIFDFIAENGPVERREMFGNFNMGAGFALYLPESELPRLQEVYSRTGPPYTLTEAGYVEQCPQKLVRIEPERLEFLGKELDVR